MKILIAAVSILFAISTFAQRDLTPGKRRGDVFGKADYKDYRFYGLQVSAGPTFPFTRFNKNNPLYSTTDELGRPMDYTFDPGGKLGVFLEVGLAHFPQKRSKLSQKLKFIFVSYYDWGLGFKLHGGSEKTTINYYNAFGEPTFSEEGQGDYYNGYVYGRFTLHKNININKRLFIDNGLGVNFDFRVINGNREYDGASLPQMQSFHKPLVAQLHYDLGLGFKLSRRFYFIPGAQIPLISFHEWRGGCADLKWFSSNYLPVLYHLKFIYLFEKKVKGCNVPGTEEDKKRNNEFLQNN